MENSTTADISLYTQLLRTFINNGIVPDALLCGEDALAVYLIDLMNQDEVRKLVRNDKMAARVFSDTVEQFAYLCLEKAVFHRQRANAELYLLSEALTWSSTKRREEWKELWQHLTGKYGTFGMAFYHDALSKANGTDNDALWESFICAGKDMVSSWLEEQKAQFVSSRRTLQNGIVARNIKQATTFARKHGIGYDDFCQIWALMGGRWNAMDFERLQKIARLQHKYPVLLKITNTMGRVADDTGLKSIGSENGTTENMAHASQSDITGISIGRDLGALLPSEWAHYCDEELEDVFLQKYVTGRLQTFGYQSRSLNAARSLHKKSARPRGPMVVCVDRSGSMMGEPSNVTLALMMRLTEMCHNEQRACFVIAFTAQAKAFDVLADRTKLLQFFNQRAEGDTDAKRMITSLVQLLTTNARYAGADVLWVTDFRIPLPPKAYLQQLVQLRQAETKLYGLQLGVAENHWLDIFDEVFAINDIKMAVR